MTTHEQISAITTNLYEIIDNPTRICYNRIVFYAAERSGTMNNNITENWIGIAEAAEHLGVTKDSIRNWIKKTDIPAHKVGKLWKFKKSELDEWVMSGKSAFD